MLTTYTVTTLADPGSGALSLRQAITAANTTGGTNVINFAGGLTGTINLAAALPTITCSLTINGPGASLADHQRARIWQRLYLLSCLR